uniref:Uncharacterized protein n=1 Tax=Amphimedon queenslandica TaxID=400682 RepID=A0A1X7U041_AMPQE
MDTTAAVDTTSCEDRPQISQEVERETADSEMVNKDIIAAVLKAFELADKMCGSQKDLINIVNYGRDLYCKGDTALLSRWPTSYSACMNLLKKAGYNDPVTYYICLNEAHPNLWSIMQNPSDLCKYCKKPGTIPYHYSSLKNKIKYWCSSKSFCEKMTAHWKEKKRWIHGVSSHRRQDPLLREIWDGERFAELSWFWDPDRTWLLPVGVNSVDQFNIQGFNRVHCPMCHSTCDYLLEFAKGDPRNIALIGHWDGWQPFSTSCKHSCGSIEVQVATMLREDRSKIEEVYVCGFVPCYIVPNKMPWALDPFLDPLVTDIEDSFINGVTVEYAACVIGIEPGPATIRCLLLCWTGDHPAQCEVGKFLAAGGVHACRRDKVFGTLSSSSRSNQYYCGNYQYHYRYQWSQRMLSECVDDMVSVSQEDRITVRRKKASETGFTDGSIEERLDAIPWTAELKDGRIPQSITRRIGFWKAEEYRKFTYPASEYVLGGKLPDCHYHVWILIVRITELVFGCGRNGWTQHSLELLHNLIWRHNILTEVAEGLESCVITLHNLVHLPDDIKRFSSPDNYWCFVFERAVHTYVERSSNNKHLELTFAKAESRRELLKFLFSKSNLSTPCFQDQLLYASSITKARLCFSNCNDNRAILVGGKKTITVPSNMIQSFVPSSMQPSETVGVSCRSVLLLHHGFDGVLYKTGEHILLSSNEVICATDLFSLYLNNHYQSFVEGELFCVTQSNLLHLYSNNPFVSPSSSKVVVPTSSILRKVMLFPDQENLKSPTQFVIIDFERDKIPLTSKNVIIPFYPESNDMVEVYGEDGDIWLAQVQSVDIRNKTCRVHFFVPQQNCPSNYCREQAGRRGAETISCDSVLGQACGSWSGNTFIYT